MIDLIRSEWFKLRTLRLNYVLLIIGFGFVLGIMVLVGVFVPSDDLEFGAGPSSGDIVTIVGVASVLSGLLVSVVGALSVTAEFGHGTIRPTLVATPSRAAVFGAKAIVLSALATVVGLLTGLVPYLAGYAILSARGAEELSLFDSDGTVAVLVGMPFFFVMLTLFGYGLGLLIRNSPATVATVILWPIIIENVFQTALAVGGVEEPVKFLPYLSAVALVVADPQDYANGRIGGGLYFGIVAIAVVVAGTMINTRRDV